MSLENDVAAAWPELRVVAGVTLMVNGQSVDAIATEDVARESADLFDSPAGIERAGVAVLRTDWDGAALANGHRVSFGGRWWRIAGYRSHPSSPLVFVALVAE